MQQQCRIACLRIPGFQIGVHQKAEPLLRDKNTPLIIVSGQGSRAKVVACSARAMDRHLKPGMKLSEAQAVVANLVWRDHSPLLYDQTQEELTSLLLSCSPKITTIVPGIVLVDATGMARLGGEEQLCKSLSRVVARFGFADAHVGVADSAFCALVASRRRMRKHLIVLPTRDNEFLSPLSIKHLPYPDLHEVLPRLGIYTMGEFANLGPQNIVERFGDDGAAAYDLCCGVDFLSPKLVREKQTFSEAADLGFPVESADQCLFILKSMLEKIISRLRLGELATDRLLVQFFNEEDKLDDRIIELMQPSTNLKLMLELIRLSLEARPLSREFTRVIISVCRFSSQKWDQHNLQVVESSLVHKDGSSDAGTNALVILLQRLLGKLGQQSVVRPVANDQHLPDNKGVWLPVQDKITDRILRPSTHSKTFSDSPFACGFVLKKSVAPEPVTVEWRRLTFRGRQYRIKELSEQERLSGLWWEQAVHKSYFVALIESCERSWSTATRYLVLLVRDHSSMSWQIEGFFD